MPQSFLGRIWSWLKENLPVSLFPYETTSKKIYEDFTPFFGHQKNLTSVSDREVDSGAKRILKNKSTPRARLSLVGSPQKTDSKNVSDTDLIIRAVMRNPSMEFREVLVKLHQAMKSKLLNQSAEALDWLLLFPFHPNQARGGFANATALKSFFNRDPNTIPSSRLITGIETLLTAIGYKGVFGLLHSEEITNNQFAIYRLCREMISKKSPDNMSISYPDKGNHRSYTRGPLDENQEIEGEERAELSDVSDAEEDMPKQEPIERRIFPKIIPSGKKRTWVNVAKHANVPFRYSISGTASLNLAVAQWLLSDTKDWIRTQNELELLAGGLIIPAYHRADYHSVAEVMVGVQHYIDYICKKTHKILSPREALSRGLSLIAKAIDPELRCDVETLSKKIIGSTMDAQYTPEKKFGKV